MYILSWIYGQSDEMIFRTHACVCLGRRGRTRKLFENVMKIKKKKPSVPLRDGKLTSVEMAHQSAVLSTVRVH